jgi:hypothetical protein
MCVIALGGRLAATGAMARDGDGLGRWACERVADGDACDADGVGAALDDGVTCGDGDTDGVGVPTVIVAGVSDATPGVHVGTSATLHTPGSSRIDVDAPGAIECCVAAPLTSIKPAVDVILLRVRPPVSTIVNAAGLAVVAHETPAFTVPVNVTTGWSPSGDCANAAVPDANAAIAHAATT